MDRRKDASFKAPPRSPAHNYDYVARYIIEGDPARHAVEVRKRPDVAVEKADLILAPVDPREVAAGVHQPHQKQPRFPPGAVHVEQHLEEVDLDQVSRPIGQRDKHLATLALPLGDRRFHDGDADPMALADQQLVEPRRRQLLLAAGPSTRLGQQRLDARAHLRPDGPRPRRRRLTDRPRLRDVLPHRPPRQPQLFGHLPLRPAFHQHLVTDDMHLVHPEHPFQRTAELGSPASPPCRPSGGSLSERRVDHFPSGAPKRLRGGWSTAAM
jgi:hypothetical protein